MGYLIGGCVNIFVILAAFVIFASLPGIFWGLMVALLVIVILAIRTGISNRQASASTIPAVSTTDSLEDEVRHHEYKNNDPAQGIQHHDNPNVSDDDEDEANR
jgi:uncharacterized protein (DUF58 family)